MRDGEKPILNYARPTDNSARPPSVAGKVFGVLVYSAISLAGAATFIEESARPREVAGIVVGAVIALVCAVLAIWTVLRKHQP